MSESVSVNLTPFVSGRSELHYECFLLIYSLLYFTASVPVVYRQLESHNIQKKMQPLFKCKIFKAMESHQGQRKSTAEQAFLVKS